MNQQRVSQRWQWIVVILPMILGAGGCGAKVATVTGTVRYRSQALPTGTVSFYCESGEIISGLISADGTYRLPRIAPGPVRVAVISHPRLPQGLQVMQAPIAFAPVNAEGVRRSALPSEPVRPATHIPDRYNRPDSSGLVFTIHPGEQTLDIDLTP